ncbi:MAG TPA: DUF3455 domain-containing protein [Steroidobacteraceae bacterium]|jgi:hypothetical protein|nr:DUF3455 domain-containing protein [Steroidobacteraceae bacterium]
MIQQSASPNSWIVAFLASGAAAAVLAAPATSAAAKQERTVEVPASLQVPEGHVMVFQAIVVDGVQTYRCTPERKYALLGPTAMLRGRRGEFVAHYFGPSWQYQDGSTIVGKVIAKEPRANSIDQLLLQVSGHSGPDGVLSQVDFVQRLATVRGVAPSQCDPARSTALAVPYSAIYQFWAPKT